MTRSEMRRESVDLSALVNAVVEELRGTWPEHDVDVVVEEGLVANGDESLLRVALQNLLGNAWKFTRDQPDPRIEFGMLEHEDAPAYFVLDNGVGFDMAYTDKLFGAFQRLHSTGERSEEHTLNSSHANISYAVFCLKKKNTNSVRRPPDLCT